MKENETENILNRVFKTIQGRCLFGFGRKAIPRFCSPIQKAFLPITFDFAISYSSAIIGSSNLKYRHTYYIIAIIAM